MSRAATALVAAGLLTGGVAPARAIASADGFWGYEKQVTHVTGQGEPSIAVGPHGRPLIVSYSGCGAAAAVEEVAVIGRPHRG